MLQFFHTQPDGSYVMCDSNNLRRLLKQILVRNDFQLVANDLDDFPLANRAKNVTIKCKTPVIRNKFAAPEQRWKAMDEVVPGYDEKADIWKIPDVCEFFTSTPGATTPGYEALHNQLVGIHGLCKRITSSERPSAEQVLQEYLRVFNSLR